MNKFDSFVKYICDDKELVAKALDLERIGEIKRKIRGIFEDIKYSEYIKKDCDNIPIDLFGAGQFMNHILGKFNIEIDDDFDDVFGKPGRMHLPIKGRPDSYKEVPGKYFSVNINSISDYISRKDVEQRNL